MPESAADLQLFELKGELPHLAESEGFGAPNLGGMVCTLGVQKMFVQKLSGAPNDWTPTI
jgi:hypothetical protein